MKQGQEVFYILALFHLDNQAYNFFNKASKL